ncbi:MAG: efflux RND transporter permease subunit, partial [Rhizobacter sp.]|nr:efflux RND transporter permease subunit [Chlorobiales bacterium]
MSITELSIKRPTLIVAIFIVLTALGLVSYSNLRYELLPKIDPPAVTVIAVYPGASPSEVETSVTKVIEDAVSTVDKIKRISAQSGEGVATVAVEFQMNADANLALQDVQRKVNEIVSALPAGVKSPEVIKYSLADLPVLRVGVTSLLPPQDLSELLKQQVKPRLSQIAGAGQITFVGMDEREVQVSLRAASLEAYHLSILQVLDALKTSNRDVPAGKLKESTRDVSVRVTGKFKSVADVQNAVVHTTNTGGASGAIVRLSDVADVFEGGKDQTIITRLNGKSSVALLVQKQSDANAVSVSEGIRAEIKLLEGEFAEAGLKFDVAQDASRFTLEAAEAVNHDLILAIIFVALVMLVFLHSLRDPLIVMVAIPTSLVTTFIFMYLLGFSLNLMTLLAMSLAIGILVDDAMVVHENIARHLAMGKDKMQAALDGRNEIEFSAISITLVDVVVFLPISFVSGLIGNILREFALVMVVSTLTSLFVSFTLTPMLASRFIKHEHLDRKTWFGKFGLWFEHQFETFTAFYAQVLKWAFSHRWVVATAAAGLLIGSLALAAFGVIGAEFISSTDRSQLAVILETQQGTKLSEMNRIAQAAEEKLRAMPEVKTVFASVGTSSDSWIGGDANGNTAELNVSLIPKEERSRPATEIGEDIKRVVENFAGVKVRIAPIGIFGSADDAPIILTMRGANRDSVLHAAEQLSEIIRRTAGTDGVRLSLQMGKPESRVELDHARMAAYGLSTEAVGEALRVAYTGDDDLKFQSGDNDVKLRVRLGESDRAKASDLERLKFITSNGDAVELGQFASFVSAETYSKLERRNRQNSVTVYAQVLGRATGDVGAEILEKMKKIQLPQGVKLLTEGDLEYQSDAFDKLLLAFAAAVLFVYLIMVALYNSWVYPFVVLFSIPVAIVGALAALAITGHTLNIFSLLGVIMLVGLVAKNAILIVDYTNQLRAQGSSVEEALITAGRTRLRPILMTTMAMVVGMLPIATASGAGAEWKNGLAWVLIGGLTSSLLLTLILVPTVYIDIERLRSWSLRMAKVLARKFSQTPETSKPSHEKSGSLSKPAALTILLLTLASPVRAQVDTQMQAKSLSMREAVTLGLERNIDVQIAALGVRKSDEQVREATSAVLPVVSASGQYIRNVRQPVFFFPNITLDET